MTARTRRTLRLPRETEPRTDGDTTAPTYPLPETMPDPQTKITPNDVMAQIAAMRAVADTLPDSQANVRLKLQQGLDAAQAMVKSALPKPGVYVTAGSAAAIGGIAAIIGAIGGGLVGHKLAAGKKPAALPAAREASDHGGEMTLDDEIAAYEGVAAEAKRRAKAAREARDRGNGKRNGAAP